MKIIKGYWSNETEEIKAEEQIKDYLKTHDIKNVFIGHKKIKKFEISTDEDNRFLLKYSKSKNGSLKYYFNLLAKSIAVKNNNMVLLWDTNFEDYKTNKLTEKTLKELNF